MELTYTVTVRVDTEDNAPEQDGDAMRDFADQVLADRLMVGDERPVAENSYSGLRLWGVAALSVDVPAAAPVD